MKPIVIILTLSSIFLGIKMPAFASTDISTSSLEKPIDRGYKNIVTMNLKEFQQMVGRKLTFKEKVSFFVLKHKMKHQQDNANQQGQTAFIFGLVGVGLLALVPLVPFIIFGSLVASILAIVFGTMATKKDGDNRKAKAGKLLGWITLSIITLLFILAAIIVASFKF